MRAAGLVLWYMNRRFSKEKKEKKKKKKKKRKKEERKKKKEKKKGICIVGSGVCTTAAQRLILFQMKFSAWFEEIEKITCLFLKKL